MISKSLPILKDFNKVRNKRVIVRVDFNVPAGKGNITDDFRIVRTLPLLYDLRAVNARLVLLSHLTEKKEHRSFEPLMAELNRICVSMNIVLAKTIKEARDSSADVILLENLRIFSGEESGNSVFAEELASLGDVYINEDFSQSHRPYASIVLLPQLRESYAGPLFLEEAQKLEEALNPDHPFMLILGGMKFQTKVTVLEHFIEAAETIFIGGALANTFLAAQGKHIGASLIEKNAISYIQEKFLPHKKLIFPVDVRVDARGITILRDVDQIQEGDTIYDIGPRTAELLERKMKGMHMVLWNGPLGFIERGFTEGTEYLLNTLSSLQGVKIIIGGGDTMGIIRKHSLEKAFHHLSTGGGAMLEFLAKGTLPGIEALTKHS